MVRQRHDGSTSHLVDKLSPIVSGRGRRFLVWDDSEKVKKSKFCQRSLDKASEVLAGLHAVNPKLVFSKSQLIDVCRQLYDKNAHLAT